MQHLLTNKFMNIEPSKAGELNSLDIKSIIKHAVLVAVSASLAYLATVIPNLHLDQTTSLLVMGGISLVLKFLDKLLTGVK